MKFFNNNPLLKVLSLNSISVAVSFVLGILSTKIISLFLGAPGMAVIGSLRNFTTMLKSMATLGINNSVVKFVVENKNDKKELSIIYSTFFWLFLIISSLLGLTTLLFSKSISELLFFSDSYVIPIQIFGLILPLLVINTFWLAIYNGLEEFKKVIYIQIISNVLIFVLTAILIWKQKVLGGLLSIVFGELIMVFVTFIYVRNSKEYFVFDLQKIIDKKHLSVIKKFSIMALLSAIIAPLTLIFIRNFIIKTQSIHEAGVWDAINRLSSFYMLFFSSGLSLYYMPKLASLTTEIEFKNELKNYFKTLVPLFLLLLIVLFFAKGIILKIAFTSEFNSINKLLIWQLLGDFFRIMTLAFGFQILVKTMMKKYFLIEIVFNLSYLLFSIYSIRLTSIEGALKAYFYSNVICFVLVLLMFRNLFKNSLKTLN